MGSLKESISTAIEASLYVHYASDTPPNQNTICQAARNLAYCPAGRPGENNSGGSDGSLGSPGALEPTPPREHQSEMDKAREITEYIEPRFKDISKDKDYITTQDLDDYSSSAKLTDAERRYVSFLRTNFSTIANIVPDSNEPNPYSRLNLHHPRQLDRMSLEDVNGLKLVGDEYLRTVLEKKQASPLEMSRKYCADVVERISRSPFTVGFGLGSHLDACVIGGSIKAYSQMSLNRQMATWFPEKQKEVREMMSRTGF